MHFIRVTFIVAVGFAVLVVPGMGFKLPKPPSEAEVQKWRDKLIGKKLVSEDAADFDENTQFKESELPSSHRIIRPNSAVTMDYRNWRLNVDLDENDTATDLGFY